MKEINPFVVSGYFGKQYFCDREKELAYIVSAIENGRNLNLYNIRRIGKSALVQHALATLPTKKYVSIFIDIEKTESQEALSALIAEKLMQKLDGLDVNFFRKIIKWASGFGATVGVDAHSGTPKVSFNYSAKENNLPSLEQVFELTKFIDNKQFVVAIDEFQQILNYPEQNTEALMRSVTQQFPHIRFIFSGSSRHLMAHIFADVKQPFYQSTEHLALSKIDRLVYLKFAQQFLSNTSEDKILEMIDWCRCHTYYVQYALNLMYEIAQNGEVDLASLKNRILESHEFYYFSIRKLISKDQWNILKIIAKNEPLLRPTSAEVLGEAKLAGSTMKYNIHQLEDKDLIYREEDGYHIYNVFLGRLLEQEV